MSTTGEAAVTVGYTKTDPEPSLSREEVMAMQTKGDPPENPEAAEVSHTTSSTAPTWLFVLLGGVVLAAMGGFIWYRSQSGSVSTVIKTPGFSAASEISKTEPSAEFCTQCGATLKTDARFCHVCGTPCPADVM